MGHALTEPLLSPFEKWVTSKQTCEDLDRFPACRRPGPSTASILLSVCFSFPGFMSCSLNMLSAGLDSGERSEGFISFKSCIRDFPAGPVVKNLPANAGDAGSIPGLGRSHMSCGD